MWHNLLKLRGLSILGILYISIHPELFLKVEILIHPEYALCAQKPFITAEKPLISESHTKTNRPFFQQIFKILIFEILIHPRYALCARKPFLTAERPLISATTLQICAWEIPWKGVFWDIFTHFYKLQYV